MPDAKYATKIVKIATKRNYSDGQNIIFQLSKWMEMQKPFLDMSLICSHAWNSAFVSILEEVDRRTGAMPHCRNCCQNHQKCCQRIG